MGPDKDLLILIFGVTFARRQAAAHAACPSLSFTGPRLSAGMMMSPAAGCEHFACPRCCVRVLGMQR